MRFPEFEGEWKKYKISDFLEFFTTNSLSWDQLEYDGDGISNLHYGLIHKGVSTQIKLDEYKLPKMKPQHIPKDYTLVKDGDVAFADASEDTNEVAKVVEFLDCLSQKVVCGLHTIHGRDKLHITINGFKGYAFSSIAFHHQIRRLAQGTKIYAISQKNFNESYIGIPIREEQAKIAKLMLLIDERISTQSKIIEKIESLIKGLLHFATRQNGWKLQYLRDLLEERKEFNISDYPVFSVAVREGVINQIKHLGRSFAAKDTSNYNVVRFGDIVYTKSPTGSFPYGIVKQSLVKTPVAISPLYGVYEPKNIHVGNILHHYFSTPVNANNYLHSLIQKGAKNTINITTKHFLDKAVLLPINEKVSLQISLLLTTISEKITLEKDVYKQLEFQKQYLLQLMFI